MSDRAIPGPDPCPNCGSRRVYLLADDISPTGPWSWGWACLACLHKWPHESSGPAKIAARKAERAPAGVRVPKQQTRCEVCGAWRNATEPRCLVVGCAGAERAMA